MKTPCDSITVLLESCSPESSSQSFSFANPVEIISAVRLEEVTAAMKRVESLVATGFHAAGYVSYEAGAAFNPNLPVSRFPSTMPLLWFGIFEHRHTENHDRHPALPVVVGEPHYSISRSDYIASVSQIKTCIANGESYQINYTFRATFPFSAHPSEFYRQIRDNQRSEYCAYIDSGDHQILSTSPELFFSLKNGIITMKPMKGTIARCPDTSSDRQCKEALKHSGKDRAENLMIVDLVRNDLGMLAETGSVQAVSLFDVETYPTVHQMTSTIRAAVKEDISVTDIFTALFPCGSVTGAPKRRSMEIIDRLESSERGVYCGAIGYISPGREAVFSVAIRTAVIHAAQNICSLGIGGGITWDSDPDAEYNEAVSKSLFVTRNIPDFQLIESLRYDDGGYLLLERHLNRLAGSADYFGFRFDRYALQEKLLNIASKLNSDSKIRVLLNNSGTFTITAENLAQSSRDSVVLIALSEKRLNPADPFLYHKTTNRQHYDDERKMHPDCYDVIFLNTRDEVMEGSYNNIVVSIGGTLLTPALKCGLLAGVLREELIENGVISESVLTIDDLQRAEKIWLINSVRGWQECRIESNRRNRVETDTCGCQQ